MGSGDEIALNVAKRQVIRESFIISCMYGRGACVCVVLALHRMQCNVARVFIS